VTIDPRAATGTLEELLLVAAFTKEAIAGACARNNAALESRKRDESRIADNLLFPCPETRRKILRIFDGSRFTRRSDVNSFVLLAGRKPDSPCASQSPPTAYIGWSSTFPAVNNG
jgi:hypothetical protein